MILQNNPAYCIPLSNQYNNSDSDEAINLQRNPSYLLKDQYADSAALELQKNPAYRIPFSSQYSNGGSDEAINLQKNPSYLLDDQYGDSAAIELQKNPAYTAIDDNSEVHSYEEIAYAITPIISSNN